MMMMNWSARNLNEIVFNEFQIYCILMWKTIRIECNFFYYLCCSFDVTVSVNLSSFTPFARVLKRILRMHQYDMSLLMCAKECFATRLASNVILDVIDERLCVMHSRCEKRTTFGIL